MSTSIVKSLAEKHGRVHSSLLPILQGIVAEENYLSEEAMIEVAEELNVSAAQVYGTATFYHFLGIKPQGQYVIRICKTISCSMKGKLQVLEEIERSLKIKVGETTPDKKFTLLETNCLGQCHEAPAMLINDVPYTGLTPERVRSILEDYSQK